MTSLAGTFQHPGVARAYACRPEYQGEVLDLLVSLAVDGPGRVLDLGAGEGALARPLAERFAHVDAVEISAAMVTEGRSRPGGDPPNLDWHLGSAEDAPVTGPYALATAGASLHWMDGSRVLHRLRTLLAPGAVFAVVEQSYVDQPWHAALRDVIVRHSRSRSFDRGYSVVDELVAQGLFVLRGRRTTAPSPLRQPIAGYVEQFFSTSSLARELMPAAEARRFADAVTDLVRPYADADGILAMQTTATIEWGIPAGSR